MNVLGQRAKKARTLKFKKKRPRPPQRVEGEAVRHHRQVRHGGSRSSSEPSWLGKLWKSSSALLHGGAVKRTKQARRACASTRSDGAVKEAWSRRVAMTKRALIQHQHEDLCPRTGQLERLNNKIEEFFIN